MGLPTIINLNDTTPAAPNGFRNVRWQGDADNPRNVSAYFENLGIVNAQTGTTYTFLDTDLGKLVTGNNTAAQAYTLPAASSLVATYYTFFLNLNDGIVTIAPSSGTINGKASLTFMRDQGGVIFSSGSNWFCLRTGSTYDMVCSFVGKPDAGATVLILTIPRSVTLPANMVGSYGSVGVNPTATAQYTVKKGATTVGTINISTGGVFTFATTGGTAVSFVAGDRLTVIAPSPQDVTLVDVGITIVGARF